MCGIFGFVDLRQERRVERDLLLRMGEQLEHRGPDDFDCCVESNVAFGFKRLSIVDLEGGRQPIWNEDSSIVLICNGEIFNYADLRRDLQERGHRFRTNSDVEVILHLYEEQGTAFLNRLNGQFAFALYDFQRDFLFCARDQVGIAPFFYTVVEGMFVFASEIKAILEHPLVARRVDLQGLDQILTFPGLVSPRTAFANISSLPSGHFLTRARGQEMRVTEYWDLVYPSLEESGEPFSEEFYLEQLEDLLKRAVAYRLQADVPVGFYLSGGLDSSLVAAMIQHLTDGERLHSFSIDFPDSRISEARFQRQMAEQVQSLHHEHVFGQDEILNRLRQAVRHSESPLKETYNTASLALSQMAREQGIKVILTGEGADELFAGYVGYRFDRLRKSQPTAHTQETDEERKVREMLWGDPDFLYEKNYLSELPSKQSLYSKTLLEQFSEFDCLARPLLNKQQLVNRDVLHKRSYVDWKLRLSDHLLADHGDRMVFAHSVEGRYPFLDKDLIEFVTRIPPGLKLKDYQEKYLLKRLAARHLPAEIVNRPKFSFVAPGSPALLRQQNEYIDDLLSYERIKRQGYFNPDTVEALKKKYKADSFRLNLPFETDWLIQVITFGIFLDEFRLPSFT